MGLADTGFSAPSRRVCGRPVVACPTLDMVGNLEPVELVGDGAMPQDRVLLRRELAELAGVRRRV